MNENCQIPSPINFNCWKHHTGFIKKQIEPVKEIKDLGELKKYLLTIGESQMDLYFGEYSPAKISEQMLDYLYQKKYSRSISIKTGLLKMKRIISLLS